MKTSLDKTSNFFCSSPCKCEQECHRLGSSIANHEARYWKRRMSLLERLFLQQGRSVLPGQPAIGKGRSESGRIPEDFEHQPASFKGAYFTLFTAEQTNLQPSTMWLRRMVKSPRASGCLLCSFSTNLVNVIRSVRAASAAGSMAAGSFGTDVGTVRSELCCGEKRKCHTLFCSDR